MSSLQLVAALTFVAVAATGVAVRRRARRFAVAAVGPSSFGANGISLLAVAAVAAVGLLLTVLTQRDVRGASAADGRGGTVIVVDVSGSVSSGDSGRRVSNGLRIAARQSGGHAGLVVFADSAAEVLPPTAPAGAVSRLAHFFGGASEDGGDSIGVVKVPRAYESATPWADAFLGNTDISSGLDLARKLLTHPTAAPGSRMIVISDLEDGGPVPRLAAAVRRALHAGIRVEALPVGAVAYDIQHWRRIGGTIDRTRVAPSALEAAAVPSIPAGDGDRGVLLALCALGFAALVAGAYLWLAPLGLTGPEARVPGRAR